MVRETRHGRTAGFSRTARPPIEDRLLKLLGVPDPGALFSLDRPDTGRCTDYGMLCIDTAGPRIAPSTDSADLLYACMIREDRAWIAISRRFDHRQPPLFALACHLYVELAASKNIPASHARILVATEISEDVFRFDRAEGLVRAESIPEFMAGALPVSPSTQRPWSIRAAMDDPRLVPGYVLDGLPSWRGRERKAFTIGRPAA